MWGTILWIILLSILTLIIISLINDFRSYIWYLKHYKKQGIKFDYVPIIGIGAHFQPISSSKDQLERWKKYTQNKSHLGLITLNNHLTPRPYMVLFDPDLIREFFIKEIGVCTRINFQKIPLDNSFIYNFDHRGFRLRALTANIFKPKNMKKIMPMIKEEAENTVQRIGRFLKNSPPSSSSDGWHKIDIVPFINELFYSITAQIVVGADKKDPKSGKIPKMVDNCINLAVEAEHHLVNILFKGIPNYFGLLKEGRISRKLKKEVNKWVKDAYEKRAADPKAKLGVNMIDLLLKSNIDSMKEGRREDVTSIEEIQSNVQSFLFAGSDTTKNSVITSLYYLSKDLSLQESLSQEFFNHQNFSDTDQKFEVFDNMFKEVLRTRTPTPGHFSRRAVKDFKLGKYKIIKGTEIFIPMHNCYEAEFFPKPHEFQPNRFKEEKVKNLKKMVFAPFGSGKRSCIGKYLAELMIKTVLSVILRKFEIKQDDRFDPEWILELTYGLKQCSMYLRSKGN